MTRKFRWLPQVCERGIFSAPEPCVGFGITHGVPTQTCCARVSRSGARKGVGKVSQASLTHGAQHTQPHEAALRLRVDCSADCVQVTDTISWGLTANACLYEKPLFGTLVMLIVQFVSCIHRGRELLGKTCVLKLDFTLCSVSESFLLF